MRRIAIAALGVLCGCKPASNDAAGSPARPHVEPTVDPCSTQDCSNTVDRVLVPMLAAAGIAIVKEADDVLCRRLAIDLTGAAPTDEDEARCVGKSPRDMAAYFMGLTAAAHVPKAPLGDDPAEYAPYVYVNRRRFADDFRYWAGPTFPVYIRELDALVGATYAGQIGYDELAERALGSPAFFARYCDDIYRPNLTQLANQAFLIFMGRAATISEANDFGNLWRPWTGLGMGGADGFAFYGDRCPRSENAADPPGAACGHVEIGLNYLSCDGGQRASCQSTIFGPAEVVPDPKTPNSADEEDWARASNDFSIVQTFERVGKMSAREREAVRVPGKLLVAQSQFAEAAVDRALVKYLRWWKSGSFWPDFDVPAIRTALAAKLRADHYDVRKLDAEIVGSLLYTQRAHLGPAQIPHQPLWAFGPEKPLPAEVWLDAMARAAGHVITTCDFRYDGVLYRNEVNAMPDNLVPFPAPAGAIDGYGIARDLGGCPGMSQHSEPLGLVASLARRGALAAFCSDDANPNAPAKAFAAPAGTKRAELFDRVWRGVGRPATEEERKAFLSSMMAPGPDACVVDPASPDSCTNLDAIAIALCRSVYATARFNFY